MKHVYQTDHLDNASLWPLRTESFGTAHYLAPRYTPAIMHAPEPPKPDAPVPSPEPNPSPEPPLPTPEHPPLTDPEPAPPPIGDPVGNPPVPQASSETHLI